MFLTADQVQKQSWVVQKTVNSNPGLKVNQIIAVSSLQMLFLQLLFCEFFWKAKTYTENLVPKVAKLKSKFNLILCWPNRATGAPLLG